MFEAKSGGVHVSQARRTVMERCVPFSTKQGSTPMFPTSMYLYDHDMRWTDTRGYDARLVTGRDPFISNGHTTVFFQRTTHSSKSVDESPHEFNQSINQSTIQPGGQGYQRVPILHSWSPLVGEGEMGENGPNGVCKVEGGMILTTANSRNSCPQNRARARTGILRGKKCWEGP